jgi:hypothetical protein
MGKNMDEQRGVPQRPATLVELDAVLRKMFTKESYQLGLSFRPLSSDVIISPYAKSGTTWLQQIAHSLRTRGSMDFEEITQVTPWIEVAHDIGWDLTADQVAGPRVYKSHLSWYDIPKGGRYIVSFRHPYDAIVSFYRFYEGWLFEPGSISLEALTRWRWPSKKLQSRGYWYHLVSWWEQRYNPDVLLLCYEDMQDDLPGTVGKVAQFMGIGLDDDLLQIVVRQSTRDFMISNQYHFDEKFMRQLAEKRAGIPPNGSSNKVTRGSSDEERYQLPPSLADELDDNWSNLVEVKFGFKDYEDLRQALRKHQSASS